MNASPKSKILVLEDDEILRAAVAGGLRLDGYDVVEAEHCAAARAAVAAGPLALLLLDVSLPDGTGLEILSELRVADSRTPVLVLTAHGSEEDRVLGFEHGCDDYVVKPFSLKELRLRIQALLRRARPGKVSPAKAEAREARIGTATIDFAGHRLVKDGIEQRLAPKELDMLRLFLSRPGEVITREEFLSEVWGYDRAPLTRTVDMHVRKLREKLEPDPENPRHLLTVHGAGYRFDP